MSYELELRKQQNLIVITFDEMTDLDDRVKLLDKVIDYLCQDPTIRILIDARKTSNQLTEGEQIEFGELLGEKSSYFSKTKIAIVKNPDLHPVMMPVAFSEGHTNHVEFVSKLEAIAWLKGEIR